MSLATLLDENKITEDRSKIAEILGKLSDSDRTTLEKALHPDSGYRHVWIAKALRKKGYSIGETSVKRYRDRLKEGNK